ncbi:class I SAM-dependent methyltransferase [Paraburkholderia antibiotica]|uniref:Class I SAM-dependent methyltransferase n=1 Tax=Paraburkholderia antibiotica TaxID=2728839 RepID=A0A7X9ZXR9_9BURK|nr:class I SAM-dependent methyltransferase [Paraburkholderia antibiotica]NML30895.1 class I SAM-dependent methyltransferase [Paraburkholderia antibiotica]
MNLDPLSDSKIIDAWRHNAAPWQSAVRDGAIESRRLATDQAVLDAVLACEPASLLDLGCGEGWLALALQRQRIDVTAVDVVAELVRAATDAGVNDARVLSYEEIAAGALDLRVDVVVCNFSLLGKESVDDLLRAMPTLLAPGGSLIVQTLHPVLACGDAPYVDGWRSGSWAGFGDAFSDAPPWYFRTLQTWIELIGASGLVLRQMREPLHPRTGKPASVIFRAQAWTTGSTPDAAPDTPVRACVPDRGE